MPCLLYGFTPVNARPKHVTAAHCLQRIPLVALFQSLWGRQMSQNDGKNCVVNKIAFKKIPSTYIFRKNPQTLDFCKNDVSLV